MNPSLFWNNNIDLLDYRYNCNLIIERVVWFGEKSDDEILFKIYTLHKIKKRIKKLYIYNDSRIDYFSKILNLKKEDFRCYGKTPSHLRF
jgi:hypothetical protein